MSNRNEPGPHGWLRPLPGDQERWFWAYPWMRPVLVRLLLVSLLGAALGALLFPVTKTWGIAVGYAVLTPFVWLLLRRAGVGGRRR
jgi:hypothetical protein